IGLGLGLLSGILIAFLLDRIDRRIRELPEAEEIFALPVLGVMHDVRRRGPASKNLTDLPPGVAEAFGLLRARLRYFNVDRDIRTVVVASAVPGEGKSWVAWHLARAAARSSGTRVLLIEADMRRPSLSRVGGALHPAPGLSEYLSQDIPLDEVLQ